ncbi:hypothetical protein AAHA92_29673 [Salvia divinorum]|uniref:Uncharacterized protein n=1 Tax=Salvia divinorum TaxID=28513 RepID=A0ABD1FZ50_SALDI
MTDRKPSPELRLRRHAAAEDGGGGGGRTSCTEKSCQSCTAGAITDCVALCRGRWRAAACGGAVGGWRRGNAEVENRRREGGVLEIVVSESAAGEGAAEEWWLELAEVGHLGFGRVSSARISFYTKGN